jgi:alpha-glucosidase/alpha-D-xyloside xylohydrolase
VRLTESLGTIAVDDAAGAPIQTLTLDAATAGLTFTLPKGPLLGLGEGGVPYDKKGTTDQMRNGQVNADADGYRLAINGTRAPVQWLVGTDGWASSSITLRRVRFSWRDRTLHAHARAPSCRSMSSSCRPKIRSSSCASTRASPDCRKCRALDVRLYASSRTLDGPAEILGVARTMREKKLPCDTLIYLGTEFAPSDGTPATASLPGTDELSDPKKMLDELHALNFKIVVHVVVEGRRFTGRSAHPCTAAPCRQAEPRTISGRPIGRCRATGRAQTRDGRRRRRLVPDQGDGFDGPSRLARHRMYWEGTTLPPERATVRATSQCLSRHSAVRRIHLVGRRPVAVETLKTHVGVAINTGLTGLPYWALTSVASIRPPNTPVNFTSLVPVRGVQSIVSLARAQLAPASALGWDGGDGGPSNHSNGVRIPRSSRTLKSNAFSGSTWTAIRDSRRYLYTAVSRVPRDWRAYHSRALAPSSRRCDGVGARR